jgi:hypothetical protein
MRSSSTAAAGGLAVLLALIVVMLVALDSPIVLAQPTDPNANVAKKAPPPRQPEVGGLVAGAHAYRQAHADPAGRSEHDQEERARPVGASGKRQFA